MSPGEADGAPGRVVVVGASLAGVRTALGLRRAGFTGTVTLVGAEPWLPYDRPPLSKQVLLGEWPADRTRLASPEQLAEQGIEVRLGDPADALDEQGRAVLLGSGARIDFDALVVATGAAPRPWPFPTPATGVYDLRRLDDALAIRDAFAGTPRVVVIGAGFIGTELASAAARRDLSVDVVEPQPVPLAAQLGTVAGAALLDLHRRHGVRFHAGRGVVAVRGRDRVESVELDDGTLLDADLVVVGIGVLPNTGWLRGSSLDLADGIRCAATGVSTTNPAIWAVGDVARWPVPGSVEPRRVEHWTSAVEQAGVVAYNLLQPPGARRSAAGVPYVWTDHYGLKVQLVGLAAADDETTVVHRSPDGERFVAVRHAADRVSAALAFGMPETLPKIRGAVRSGATVAEAAALFG
ncbi:NAD(P)/FAD-dependent oxidoreductase [Plantactinospora soyae]|uniref:3-phenylpropionate/trans-cinnamate dioxygenase ferredoxin reductase subunit n=1 Tax=Plantactinospora soyae TaxID=1544732 RepID=A0A927LY11_9ACTN|nr:FAD-dependent oxidoreductase [Plantactinospora soyae]MBE1484479.1 3-phenylpropionate/trans-cinnamate dioxygenase ferredoxin reductase subunit [Plantactinospora soyae]